MNKRSDRILCGLEKQYYRATYKSMGFSTEDLKRPVIGSGRSVQAICWMTLYLLSGTGLTARSF